MNSSIGNKYHSALETIPAPGTGCHTALLGAANLGRMAGLQEEQVFADIRANIPHGGRRVPDREIRDAIRKAWQDCEPPRTQARARRGHFRPKPTEQKKPFHGGRYRAELIRRNAGAQEVDLWEASPIRIEWEAGPQDATETLRRLYRPTDIIFIGDQYGKRVNTVERHLERIEKTGRVPPHIMLNPVDGQEHQTAAGTASRRCDAAVCDYRFALCEFDEMSPGDQCAFWLSIIAKNLLPVAALVHSGGKSVHAWLHVDLPDMAMWKSEIRDGLYHPDTGRMALLGSDRACQNPSRLSRLPGHFRAEKNKFQRLLYLNTEAGK